MERDIIVLSLGLEPSVAHPLLGAKEALPCAGLFAFGNNYKLKGPFCNFALNYGSIKDMSKLFNQAKEASRDDTEMSHTTLEPHHVTIILH